MTRGAVADMLPRQRRAGVARDGARRERMRPWQRPGGGRRSGHPARDPRAPVRAPTECGIPCVAFPVHPPAERPGSGHRPFLARAAAGMSANRQAQPQPTDDIRPFSERSGTAETEHDATISPCSNLFAPRSVRWRAGLHPGSGTIPRAVTHLSGARPGAQSGRHRSPPGPVRRLRGMRRRYPPARCVPHNGPTHAAPMEALPSGPGQSARPGARPHTRGTRGHREPAAREGPDPRGRAPRTPCHMRRSTPGRRADRRAAPTRPTTVPRCARGPAPVRTETGPGGPPPLFLRVPSAFPSRFLRLPLATTAPPVPRVRIRPAVLREWPVRTTIPPYGRPALNGRDAANYAGLTDVLSRAAYSSGLGQMRVRPECRGSSLGRTRYECRAPPR